VSGTVIDTVGRQPIPGATIAPAWELGFFHVPDERSVMYPHFPGNCRPAQLSAAEKFHAALAYSRPRGNRDPDSDPSTEESLAPPHGIRMYH
jgi:hypothetical protein